LSLFKKSSETGKNVRDKILIFGPTHTSKTHAALGWPDPAIVDVENRAGHFSDRFDFFHAQPRTMDDILEVIAELKSGRIGCKTFVLDSYSAIYVKLVAVHTTVTSPQQGKVPVAVTDYATVNRRVAPIREFIFSTIDQDLIVVAHQQQKYDRAGNNFSKRKEVEFMGDEKFRYAFDYVFRTEPTGSDPRTHAVKFVIEKSASPKLKIGDVLAVKPNEKLYDVFRQRVGKGETAARSSAAAPPSPEAAPAPASEPPQQEQPALLDTAVANRPLTREQIAAIAKLQSQLGLNHGDIGVFVLGITEHRYQDYKSLTGGEAQTLIAMLEKQAAGS